MKKLFNKKFPNHIPKEIEEKYIDKQKNTIEIRTDGKINPFYDLLIKLYYFPYLQYIFRVGGAVFFEQLAVYMKKTQNMKKPTLKQKIKEMEQFGLVKSENKWNNKYITMTSISTKFFVDYNLKIRQELGSLKNRAFQAEHLNQFLPKKREIFEQYIQDSRTLISNNKLQEFKNRNIYTEKISKNTKNEILITFGILDILDTFETKTIIEKIEYINSSFNHTNVNTYFAINVCATNQDRYHVLLERFAKETDKKYIHPEQLQEMEKNTNIQILEETPKHDKYYIKADKFKYIKFTNLHIDRFFTHNSANRARKQQQKINK